MLDQHRNKDAQLADFVLVLLKFQVLEQLMIVPSNLEGRILQADWPGYNVIGPTEKGRWEYNKSGWWFVEGPTARNLMCGYTQIMERLKTALDEFI